MELYLFYQNEYERLYNCSIYDIDQIPLEKRQHKILGIFFIILSTIYVVSKYNMRKKLRNKFKEYLNHNKFY